MKDIALRPYQTASVEGLRDGIRAGHRSQVLVAATGAGKTVIAAYLMEEARAKGSRVAFVVDRVALVDQTSATLDSYGIPHGVVQADHWRRHGWEHIQVCSAQTLEKRGFFPDLKLLIVDECHAIRKTTADLIRNATGVKVIGLTATPLTKGMSALYSNVVNVTTTNQLIADGFLVPLTMYAARAIDMAGAKVVAGEWAEKEIEKRGNEIVGDIVAEWVDKTMKHFGGPVKTIVFSATVDHGEELCRNFQAAGYNFQQISYKDTNDERRRELIEEFRKEDSSIDGLVSCEVLSRGFDVPDVLCGISARPYRKSLSSHIQQLGRVMRPAPGKTFGLWLDHSGNALRFKEDTDRIFAEGFSGLDDGELESKQRKEPTEKEKEVLKCGACGFVLPASAKACPACGKERSRRSLVETVAGEMVALGHNGKPLPDAFKDRDAVWRQIIGYSTQRKPDPDAARRFALAQFKNIYGAFPKGEWNPAFADVPTLAVANRIRSNLIRYAKSKYRRAA